MLFGSNDRLLITVRFIYISLVALGELDPISVSEFSVNEFSAEAATGGVL